ncbi:uncharacterized protein V1510DRAFT_435407 [Dipodascopsis tothii]|uniref:uncharacterized protein n=1 Tax=Dipodascopsis tothii TaxID=44089 RepID=UPI0034CF808D
MSRGPKIERAGSFGSGPARSARSPARAPPSVASSASASPASSRRQSFQDGLTAGGLPTRLPPATTAPSASSVAIYDALEREQEAIVNKLQRELSLLREESTRSRSRSPSNASLSSATSSASAGVAEHRRANSTSSTHSAAREDGLAPRDARRSFGAAAAVPPALAVPAPPGGKEAALRKENDALKKKLAEMARLLAERERELEALRRPRA